MAGGGQEFGQVIGQINQAEQIGRSGVPGYISPSQLTQASVYQPTQAGLQTPSQISPFAQQMMQRAMAPQVMGLPAALMQMQGQLTQPMMRGPIPQYVNPALNYRPDMTQVQTNLNRVVPSVAEQQRLQAIEDARIAAEKAEEERLRPPASVYDSGGGG
jgi:hypothetical protein